MGTLLRLPGKSIGCVLDEAVSFELSEKMFQIAARDSVIDLKLGHDRLIDFMRRKLALSDQGPNVAAHGVKALQLVGLRVEDQRTPIYDARCDPLTWTDDSSFGHVDLLPCRGGVGNLSGSQSLWSTQA